MPGCVLTEQALQPIGFGSSAALGGIQKWQPQVQPVHGSQPVGTESGLAGLHPPPEMLDEVVVLLEVVADDVVVEALLDAPAPASTGTEVGGASTPPQWSRAAVAISPTATPMRRHRALTAALPARTNP